MSEPVLLIEKSEGIATLTLNRPDKMNALSRALRHAIGDAFRELTADPTIGVIILTGAGRAFCAGLDLRELGAGDSESAESAVSEGELQRTMRAFPGPVIGAINGVAITGGFELALMCDLLLASPAARFADTHARIGIIPGWGLSQKLSRLIGIGRAKELAFSGNFLSAEQAERWGLVNRVVAADELLPACRALGKDMLSCEQDVLRKYKKLIDDGYGESFRQGLVLESEANLAHAKTLTPAGLEARRHNVQSRGREQSK